MTNLNCFIASAFGREDVDHIYDDILLPLLAKRHNIKLNRVDRINHNKEITTKIIELIQQADFGIIDLTYARPSVYFEAGYLEGLKRPVIYIVKDDHFNRKPDDINGNEIVHFDLSVKNIIPWSQLQEKLSRRVSLIIRPILSKQQDQLEELEAKTEFEKLSLRDRILTVERSVKKHLKALQFKERENPRSYTGNFLESKGVRVFVTANDSVTQRSIYDYTQEATSRMQSDGFAGIRVVIFCSLNKIPNQRREKALRLYTKANENLYFYGNNMIFFIQMISSIQKLNKILESIDFPIDAPENSEPQLTSI